jgi:carbon storage regulator
MLVRSRRPDETVCIGDSAEAVVVQVRSDTARIGIEAPRSIQVDRHEIYLRKRTEPLPAEPARPVAHDIEQVTC